MSKIAFIGTGAMGTRMAKHLVLSGHDVSVWNRTKARASELVKAGAVFKPSPYQAALGADYVISMVRDDKASKDIWLNPNDGALRGMSMSSIAIECSTLTPKWIQQLSMMCNDVGVGFADAPVAGSRPQADMAQLIFLVGAAPDTFALICPLLEQMGSSINHVGPISSGAKIKLVVNALLGLQVAGIAELLGYLQNNEININTALEIIANTPVCSVAAAGAANAMLTDNFAAAFPIELVAKDMSYLALSAAEKTADVPLAKTVGKIFQKACDEKLGDLNINAVAKLYW